MLKVYLSLSYTRHSNSSRKPLHISRRRMLKRLTDISHCFQVVVDYDDLIKIPYFRNEIEILTNEAVKLRYPFYADLYKRI